MTRSELPSLVWKLSLVSGLLMPPVLHAQPTPRAEQPQVEVGDTWTYETRNLLTDAKDKKAYVVKKVSPETIVVGEGRSRRVYTLEWNEIEHGEGDAAEYSSPAHVVFQFPLEVGKRWEARFVKTSKEGKHRWVSKIRVEKTERVTVPAGTFDTFKLRTESYADSGKVGVTIRHWDSIWFAPEVKRWVRKQQERRKPYKGRVRYDAKIEELLSFTPGASSR